LAVDTDDLSTPLGQGTPRKRRTAFVIPWAPLSALCLGVPVAVFTGWAMFMDEPFGGEPMAVAPAVVSQAVATQEPPATIPAAPAQAPAPPPGAKTVTIIDGSNGTRRDIVIPGTADEPPPASEDRLTEQSRHGPLPKVASDGTRPADAYAQPIKSKNAKANGPRIALVVGGLGIGANGTAEALRKLPGPVTLAFAPYGNDLERQVARARESGHEVLLQVPMEPFDYPDNDPGPHTLLTSLDAAQNLDRLHWLMSRVQGYVGLVNDMGGRFAAAEQAMSPVLKEAAARGLIYLDDSSSARSLASQIAGANNVAFAKADLIIDQVPTPAEIDRALGRLETAARARGTAIGFAGALPVSIDRISRWVKAAESRGIVLVPITAVVAAAKSS
jgi:polysaccharide deacetylase 2 family uncharacterized protein YibQ